MRYTILFLLAVIAMVFTGCKEQPIDYEKELIGRIKMSCGPQYTSKVEGMLSDTNSESILIKEYYETEDYQSIKIDFGIKVLTDGYWPSFKSPPLILPRQLNE